MKKAKKEYKEKRWIRKREVILKRDGYRCRECARYGKVTAATVVHHIRPLEDHPELWLDSDNLISLCDTCHEKMHDRINGQLSVEAVKWIDRIDKNQNHFESSHDML